MNGPFQKCVIDRKIRIRKVTGKYVTNVGKSFLKEHFDYFGSVFLPKSLYISQAMSKFYGT